MAASTDSLMNLRPVTFRYLQYGDKATRQYGLIAEEVAKVYPEMVVRNEDGKPETVMYQFLAPMLLNEVQKQRRALEERNGRAGLFGPVEPRSKPHPHRRGPVAR